MEQILEEYAYLAACHIPAFTRDLLTMLNQLSASGGGPYSAFRASKSRARSEFILLVVQSSGYRWLCLRYMKSLLLQWSAASRRDWYFRKVRRLEVVNNAMIIFLAMGFGQPQNVEGESSMVRFYVIIYILGIASVGADLLAE